MDLQLSLFCVRFLGFDQALCCAHLCVESSPVDLMELPPGSCGGLLSDTDVVVLSLITAPAAPLVTVNTECSGARHRAAPKKCCVEKMAAGKRRAESAAKINLSFADTHVLQWSGSTWGRSCSSGAAGWDVLGDWPRHLCGCKMSQVHPVLTATLTEATQTLSQLSQTLLLPL